MNIHLNRAHIQNFRSIENAEIRFKPFSTLFGMNDSGKSNLLYALKLAFTGGSIGEDDVFSSPKHPFNREKTVTIDLMFIPVDEKKNRVKTFDDTWGMHFGENVNIDGQDQEFFAFRMKYSYDREKDDYVWERNLIDSWENGNIVPGKGLGFKTLSAFDFILLEAQRDIAIDIRDKNSLWNKQIAKIHLSNDMQSELEISLVDIGNKIKNESPFLQEVEKDLSNTIHARNSQIEISPVTRSISELYKGLDIYVTPESSDSFSISNLGLGTRSRAVFFILKSIIKKRLAQSQSIPYFCILALEEPEAHIYPHSQRQLISDFMQIEGQKIITTHSPYLLSLSKISNLIHVSLKDAESKYISLSELNLDNEGIRKIDRTVLNTHGDMLFSNIVILAEGETEEQALPVFIQEYFGKAPFELGITIVGIGGSGKGYLPFLQILDTININWLIFSDGEQSIIAELIKAIQKLKNIKEIDLSQYNNIIIINNGDNYEKHLIENKYKDQIIKAINNYELQDKNTHSVSPYENYKRSYIKNSQNINEDEDTILVALLRKNKTRFAKIIAETICNECTGDRKFPLKILELIKKIEMIIGGH
jgi:putative ATP-dependent endonuclease of OLD family